MFFGWVNEKLNAMGIFFQYKQSKSDRLKGIPNTNTRTVHRTARGNRVGTCDISRYRDQKFIKLLRWELKISSFHRCSKKGENRVFLVSQIHLGPNIIFKMTKTQKNCC